MCTHWVAVLVISTKMEEVVAAACNASIRALVTVIVQCTFVTPRKFLHDMLQEVWPNDIITIEINHDILFRGAYVCSVFCH